MSGSHFTLDPAARSVALAAFRRQLREVYGVVEHVPVENGPAEMDVPGFFTFEAVTSARPIRGWARDDRAVVMFHRQNFGLLLDAVDFAAEVPRMEPSELVRRLVWAHGPRYELAVRIPRGQLGMKRAVTVRPARMRSTDGSEVQLTFAVRERENGKPSTLLHYTIGGGPGRRFVVGLRQLAPPPDAEEE